MSVAILCPAVCISDVMNKVAACGKSITNQLFSDKEQINRAEPKLQALVYDILPSTTAVFSYAIGSTKLTANEQFFVGAQTVVNLLQTTQANKVYTSTNETTIV